MSEEGAMKESLSTELESIKAVYLNDLQMEEPGDANVCVNIKDDGDSLDANKLFACTFSVNLLPSTADAKMEQFVALTIRLQIPVKYPEEVPKIELKGPRGLSEEKLDKIEVGVKNLAEAKKGNSMIYELIDFVKESLTAYNFPSGKCMICLYEFTKEDVFVKTECFHHFHSYCLVGYMQSVKEKREKEIEEQKLNPIEMEKKEPEDPSKMPCPVCRAPSDLNSLLTDPHCNYPLPSLSKNPLAEEVEILKEAREQQASFSELFEKQQSQGGIIDEEKEKNKFLIRISNSPQSPKSGSSTTSSSNQSVQSESKLEAEPSATGTAQGDVASNIDSLGSPSNASNDDAISSKSSELLNETSTSQNSLPENDKLSLKCIHVTPKSIDQSQSDNSQSIDLSLLSSKLETLQTDDVDKHTPPDHSSHNVAFEKEADVEIPSKDADQDKASAAQEKSSTLENKESSKAEKGDGNTAPKQHRAGGRRRRQRSRTKSGQATVKSDGEQPAVESGQPRNRSRPRRGNFRREYSQYRPGRNRGRRRGRGRGNGGFVNGGMASPPYRHNLADGYGTESSEGRYRQSSYSGDYERPLNGSRDRPGYYAARVFKPAQPTSRPYQNKNEEAAVASGSQSNQTDATSNDQSGRSGENRRGGGRGRYSRNRTRSGRFSDGEYYQDNGNNQYNNYYNGNSMNAAPKGRQTYGYYYRPPNYPRYYDQMGGGYYPPYNYYNNYNRYGYNYNSYGYGYGYNGHGHGRGRGGYNPGRRNNYRPRNRSDTNQSQASSKNEAGAPKNAATDVVTSTPQASVSP